MFGAVVVHLQRQNARRLDHNAFDLKAGTRVNAVIPTPRTKHFTMDMPLGATLLLQAINDFFDWIDSLMCGIDLFDERSYQLPTTAIDPVVRRMRPAMTVAGR